MLQFSKMTMFILNRSNSLLIGKIRLCSSYVDFTEEEEKKPKKKTLPIPKITLLYPDKSSTVTVLEAAQRLAKRRNFNLIKLDDNDSKTNRSVYKLESLSSYKIQDQINTKKVEHNVVKYKTTKLYTMKSTINVRDLDTKIKNINKVLSKRHKVKIIISNPNALDMTDIVKMIKEKVNGCSKTETMHKQVSTLVFTPLSKDENNSLKTDVDNIIEVLNKTE